MTASALDTLVVQVVVLVALVLAVCTLGFYACDVCKRAQRRALRDEEPSVDRRSFLNAFVRARSQTMSRCSKNSNEYKLLVPHSSLCVGTLAQ